MNEKRELKRRQRSEPIDLGEYSWMRRFLRRFLGILVRIFFPVRAEGRYNIPEDGPFILVANHQSTLDLPVLQLLSRRWIHWLAKKELFSMPIIGSAVKKLGAVPLDRSSTDLAAAKRVMSLLRSGHGVGIFPQGTRVLPEAIQRHLPKRGSAAFALKTNAPIIPVAIERYRLFRPLRVVIGKPFQLKLRKNNDSDSKELSTMSGERSIVYVTKNSQEQAIAIMKQVYQLIDIRYEPALLEEPDAN